ncbi:Nucleotidyltransferase domain protein [Planococcus massiliensis]|uniref:Nucleotidyltransferase domain protein n=1 Tax=Planococcus massiliensis TaxID=1499687 RepID=A0A098EPK9_9BACL|nr:nucleotidyltransferase domain-containing protein [Planococcus massiliensis]CEG23251.1 Nucleotidyltransferase domain protein [Planococcus massiliensis]
MLPQEIAVQKITESLIRDPFIKAVFLKGSMGRNEHDEHSDIDLYCLVDGKDEKAFLNNRKAHLESYRPIIFEDDIFIIAPQLIAVFDDLLHMDLFTVTAESFTKKDFFKVLYDPHGAMEEFKESQSLTISPQEFKDAVIDVAWFMFQYKKAAARGNDVWASRMLTNSIDHVARVLMHKYKPDRAQLGLKAMSTALPNEVKEDLAALLETITPNRHRDAVVRLSNLLHNEMEWIIEKLEGDTQTEELLRRMVEWHLPIKGKI